jgi:hypothetical protein
MRPMVVVERWTAQRRHQTGVVGGWFPATATALLRHTLVTATLGVLPSPPPPLAPRTGFGLGAQDEEKRCAERKSDLGGAAGRDFCANITKWCLGGLYEASGDALTCNIRLTSR